MATLIRIKRPLASEPAENIMVKPKRQRIEGANEDGGDENTLPTGVLKRVATISSKSEGLLPEVLQEIQTRRRTGEELRRTYKRPSARVPGTKNVIKKQVQDNATQRRLKIHAIKRGNIEDAGSGKDESGKAEEECKQVVTAEERETKPGKENQAEDERCTLEEEDIKYYDAELPWKIDKDVITCNAVPMESEKFVYDLYYSPTAVDWTEFVCEVERYEYPSNSSDEDNPDDEDDENDENNWRNDYPDEEENSFEDEEDYVSRMLEWRSKQYDTDESYDADEYNDSDDFDEDGNLLQYGQTNKLKSLRLHMSCMAVTGAAKDCSDSDSENDGGKKMES